MIDNLVTMCRSYRRFDERHEVPLSTLLALVDLARLAPSAANLQPLRYLPASGRDVIDLIFPFLSWAGYLPDWPGPEPGERPSAAIVILHDRSRSKEAGCDHGLAAQNILLGAVERGLGGCLIGALDREGLRRALDLPEGLEILLVVALGKPVERVVLEEVGETGDVRYWRDEEGVHHVPKRSLQDVLVSPGRSLPGTWSPGDDNR